MEKLEENACAGGRRWGWYSRFCGNPKFSFRVICSAIINSKLPLGSVFFGPNMLNIEFIL